MICEKISVNTQSSIRIESSKVLYFDPFKISGEAHDADIIFITHEHFDHYSPDDIQKVSKADTVIVAPASMNIPGAVGLHPGDAAEISGFHVETVPAYNRHKLFHPKKKGWLGYIVEADGERVYVCGDTDATDEARSVECDVILVPIGGTYTMDPAEAADLVKAVSPKCAIPIHYGSIVGSAGDADEFVKLTGPSVEVIIKLK